MCWYCLESIGLVHVFGQLANPEDASGLHRAFRLQEETDWRSALSEPVAQARRRASPLEDETVVCRVMGERLPHATPLTSEAGNAARIATVLRRSCGPALRDALPELLSPFAGSALSPLYDATTYDDGEVWESFLANRDDLDLACQMALAAWLRWSAHKKEPSPGAWSRLLDSQRLPFREGGHSFDALFRCFFFAVSYLDVRGRGALLRERVTREESTFLGGLGLWLQRVAFLALVRRIGPGHLWASVGKVRSALLYHAAVSLPLPHLDQARLAREMTANRTDDYADTFADVLSADNPPLPHEGERP